MELESGLVASQNALIVNAPQRDLQQEERTLEQERQQQTTELPRTQVVVRQSQTGFEQAASFQQQRNVGYDQILNRRARNALNTYNSLERERRREEIREILGVDTFA